VDGWEIKNKAEYREHRKKGLRKQEIKIADKEMRKRKHEKRIKREQYKKEGK
jgi:hypothetical protein